MPTVTHFTIYAHDLPLAQKFYEQVFGWKFRKREGLTQEYLLIEAESVDEPGIEMGMAIKVDPLPFNAFVCTIQVQNIDEYVAKVKMHGGKTISPKIAIQGEGYYVPCQDTDGNYFGIMEPDETA